MASESSPPNQDAHPVAAPSGPPGGRSLRIGMLAPGYPSGAEGDYRGIFVQQMVRHLKARGHRVYVLTSRIYPGDRPFQRVDDAEQVHRFRFWSEGKLLAEYKYVPVWRMLTYMASAFLKGLWVFARYRCDLVHTHFLLPTGVIGAAQAMVLRRPHLLTVHGSDVRMAAGKRVMRPLARWTVRHTGMITAAAHHLAEGCREIGAPEDHLAVMPMGIQDIFLDPPVDAPPRPGGVLCTRTLMEDPYNVSQLIRAMGVLKERGSTATCTLMGDGPDRAALEALTNQLGLEDVVTFAGWAAPETLAGAMASYPVYVSASRSDGASVSLMEAMAAGAFPVVSDIEANREWIRDGENGLLFPLDDPAALADSIERALGDEALRSSARQANRRIARESFTWDAIAARLEELYYQLVGRRKR